MRVTLTERQFNLLKELYNRGSIDSLRHAVKGLTLADFQTRAIAQGIISESCLFNIDTGLGKTTIATGIINIMRVIKPELRWIFVCECRNIRDTYKKLKAGLYDSRVVYSDATDTKLQEVFWTRSATTADVIILSYESVVHPVAEQFLFKNRHLYKGVFIDESQLISNLTSSTSQLISSIINNAQFKFMLTATPLRINIDQFVNQVYMLDRHMFDGDSLNTFLNRFKVWEDQRVVGYRDLEVLSTLMATRLFSITRTELGMAGNYLPLPELVPSIPEYKSLVGKDAAKLMKSDPDGPALQRLYDVISVYKARGMKGLVYANLNILKKAAFEFLSNHDLRVMILDGSHTSTQKKKEAAHQAFLNGELDVLITNITTGKDLPCDYICFYEQTFDFTQMVGRGERGLQGKDLELVFILVDDPVELLYFYNNVYQRGLLLETLCGKNLAVLHKVVREIEQKLNIQDLGGLQNDPCD